MRTIILPCVFLVASFAQVQQASPPDSTVSSAMAGMKSATWRERSNAFGQAVELSTSGKLSLDDADRLRLGIFELLIKEGSGGLKEPENVPTENYGEGYGEDKSEYYAGLVGFVADLNDERAIPALLSAAGTGGMATRAVAGFGKKALDATLEQIKSGQSDRVTGALSVVKEMLKMRTINDPDSRVRIKDALRTALASPEYRVRENAMWPIEYLDDREEFVPMLQVIAERDPYRSPHAVVSGESGGGYQYPARQHAQLLLRKIANHEQPGR